MKQLLIILLCSLSSYMATAQKVEPCKGPGTKPSDLSSALVLFKNHGIDLGHYDWSNSDVNCHINMATKYAKNKQTYGVLGDLGLGLGLGGLATGIGIAAGGSSGGGALIAVGSILTVGAIAFIVIVPTNAKKHMNYHLGQVDGYFSSRSTR